MNQTPSSLEIKRQYELMYRMIKVVDFTRVLEIYFSSELRKDPNVVADALEARPRKWWNDLALAVGHTFPSDKTITWVVFYFRNYKPPKASLFKLRFFRFCNKIRYLWKKTG